MSEVIDKFVQSMSDTRSESSSLMDKVLIAAKPGSVFSEPITTENQTIITASEVFAGGTLGFGGGAGMGITPDSELPEDERPPKEGTGFGGGSGGLGGSKGRPVAAIIINPQGVKIEPIVDVTKIGLAFLTTLGAILITLFKMRRDIIKQ